VDKVLAAIVSAEPEVILYCVYHPWGRPGMAQNHVAQMDGRTLGLGARPWEMGLDTST
jgi:hypothetical protein